MQMGASLAFTAGSSQVVLARLYLALKKRLSFNTPYTSV